MEVQVEVGQHEIVFVANGYYALRVLVDVSGSGITCKKAEYGEYDPTSKKFTKIGDASCDVCATKENGVCITDFTIHGYLKAKEEVTPPTPPPPPKPSSFEEWVKSKGGCTAIALTHITELIDGYLGFIDIGFTVSLSNIATAIDCYLGLITSLTPQIVRRLSEDLEKVESERKSLIERILDDLRKKGG